MAQLRIPAVFMRGGTSRGLFLKAKDLEQYSPNIRDAIILKALGSPDPDGRQIDGLGGGISSLSKVCIVHGPSEENGYDVACRFGQVNVYEPSIDYGPICGNLCAAVATYAVDEGFTRTTGEGG
eukprot:Colp12_sorted_trinity150504_noHs@35023